MKKFAVLFVVGAFIIGALQVVQAQDWIKVNAPTGVPGIIYGISFNDAQHGIAVGQSRAFLTTSNSGDTWQVSIINTISLCDFLSVTYQGQLIVIVGNQPYNPGPGIILVSSNGGSSWLQPINPDSDNVLHAVTFLNGTLVAAGGKNIGNGQSVALVERSIDQGVTWTRIVLPQYGALLTAKVVDNAIWVTGARNTVLKSTDMGLTWLDHSIPTADMDFSAICFGGGEGYITGWPGYQVNLFTKFYATTDGGNTWVQRYSFGLDYACYGASVNSAGIDAACVDLRAPHNFNGVVLRSTNGGYSWREIARDSGMYTELQAGICEISPRFKVSGGKNFMVYHAPANPQRQDTVPTRLTVNVNQLFQFTLKWVQPGTSLWLESIDLPVFMQQLQPFMAIGDPVMDSLVLRLGGRAGAADTGSAFFRAIVRDSLGGVDTAKIQMEVTPVAGVTETGGTPQSFVLAQNYPNPFNPVTVIKFSVPYREHVTLKVFDVTGQEIATLVDEELQPGNYQADFTPQTNLGWRGKGAASSGVYFYRMQAGSYIASKKMLLLK